jgi:hypothetical protein
MTRRAELEPPFHWSWIRVCCMQWPNIVPRILILDGDSIAEDAR